MKIILIVGYLFFSLYANASSIKQEYLDLTTSSFGKTFEEKVSHTHKVLEVAQRLAQESGIITQSIILQNKQGQNYPALKISSDGISRQNRAAAEVAMHMFSLPLILSPLDLSFGADAFFDPNGSKIGVPYAFLLEAGEQHPSYLHELRHAETFLNLVMGKSPFWSGRMRLLQGEYMSSVNREYYFRLASVDELLTTALSIKHEGEKLRLSNDKIESENLLNSIYFSLQVGVQLARQMADVTQRALGSTPQLNSMPLTLGSQTRSIVEIAFTLDSYNREFVDGTGVIIPVSGGTLFSIYAAENINSIDLKKRLIDMNQLALEVEIVFKQLLAHIYAPIEFPDLAKTKVEALTASTHQPFDLLDVRK